MSETVVDAEPRALTPPRVCGDETEKLDWAGTRTFRLDDETVFGVRASTPELLDIATSALQSRLVTDVDAPAYFSLRLGTAGRRKASPLHYLYNGGRPVLATRDTTRLVAALLLHVGALRSRTGSETTLRVHATALMTPDGRAYLVPDTLTLATKQVEKELTTKGWRVADVAWTEVDPSGPDLVVERPEDGLDWSVVDRASLDRLGPSVEEPVMPFGRHRLSGWLVNVSEDDAGRLRPALAVATLGRLVSPPFAGGASGVLGALSQIVTSVPVTGLEPTSAEDLVGLVVRSV